MARAAVLGRLRAPIAWRLATVTNVIDETAQARTIVLAIPDWPGHLAGQHVDLRLTAEDGYQAQRSYSISSAPENGDLEITVERIEGGEVSEYLVGDARPGDELELRGPIGGYFTWRAADGGPLVLIAGGSVLAPLIAILRHPREARADVDARLPLSAGTLGDVLYREELERIGPPGRITMTRNPKPAALTS